MPLEMLPLYRNRSLYILSVYKTNRIHQEPGCTLSYSPLKQEEPVTPENHPVVVTNGLFSFPEISDQQTLLHFVKARSIQTFYMEKILVIYTSVYKAENSEARLFWPSSMSPLAFQKHAFSLYILQLLFF